MLACNVRSTHLEEAVKPSAIYEDVERVSDHEAPCVLTDSGIAESSIDGERSRGVRSWLEVRCFCLDQACIDILRIKERILVENLEQLKLS